MRATTQSVCKTFPHKKSRFLFTLCVCLSRYAAWLSERAGAYLPQSVALEMRILKDEGKPDAVRFHGPPVDLPAIWTMPFYDCGYSNKWLVSAVSPVVDIARSAAMRERARRQLEASGAADDVNSLRALQSIGK